MKYVVIRDDDTNPLMPVEYLERLYRPFLDKGLPVNLATIPNVNTEACYAEGKPELFLLAKKGPTPKTMPIGSNPALVNYLKSNRGYCIVQHGCRHEFVNQDYEFNHANRTDIARRLDEGARHLQDAGFPRPSTFVAPYDRLSKQGLVEVVSRFRVLSTGWYQLGKLPLEWWPGYALKKILGRPHWKAGRTLMLTHPGCHLSYHKPYDTMMSEIIKSIESRRLTVLVTHWWEYFRNNEPDEKFISILHETAEFLARRKDIKTIRFDDLAAGAISLN